MTDPYRDPSLLCPACSVRMRIYLERLVCDECTGMFLTVPDLERAAREVVNVVEVTLAFVDGETSLRGCPHCARPMTKCRLDATVDGKHPKLRSELTRCTAHGVWFDRGELETVFEKIHAVVWPPAYGGGKKLDR